MAFAGLHVACGYAGAPVNKLSGQALMDKVVWSRTMASPAVAAAGEIAPGRDSNGGDPVFQIRAAADSWAAIGAAPDATSGPRHFIPANETVTVYGEPGDKLAWIVA